MSSPPPTAESGKNSSLSLLFLALAAAAFSLAQTAIVPGVNVLGRELGASAEQVSWVMTGYLVSAAVLTPVMGRLGDMAGKKKILLVSLAMFTASSVAAALAPNVWVLIAARVAQGIGGGIFPLCYGIIADTFPRHRRPAALGLISALAGIGAGGGLLMGGLLLDHASWPWIFWSGAVISGIALAGAFRLPDSGRRYPGRIDITGTLLLATGLTAALIGLSQASSWGWRDPGTLGLMAGGVAVLAVFVLFESRTSEPLVNMSVLARPIVLMTNLAMLLFGAGMFGVFLLVPRIAQTPESVGYGFGLDATGSGLLLLPGSLVMLAAGSLSGRIGQRVGATVPLVIGSLMSCASLAGLALTHASTTTVALLSAGALGGIGLGMASMPNIILNSVPPEVAGQSTGVNALVRSVGSSIGSQVVATVLASSTLAALPLPTDGAFSTSFWIAAAACLLAAVAGALIPRRPSADDAPAAASAPAIRKPAADRGA